MLDILAPMYSVHTDTDVSTHRHFNRLFQMKTLKHLYSSTHDIKTFQQVTKEIIVLWNTYSKRLKCLC